MIKLTILLFSITLVGCCQSAYDNRLEGTWWSNKEMTLKNTDLSKLDKGTIQFLERNLGELGFAYNKNQSTLFLRRNPPVKGKSNKIKLIKSTTDSVTISSLNGPKIKLTFVGNCYFVDSTLGFNEYFCKE